MVVTGAVVICLAMVLCFAYMKTSSKGSDDSTVNSFHTTTSTVDTMDLLDNGDENAEDRLDSSSIPSNPWDSYYDPSNEERYWSYAQENPHLDYSLAVAYVNSGVDQMYQNIEPTPDCDSMSVMVNKHFYLEADYAPSDLVSVGGEARLRKEPAVQYLAMKSDMGMPIVADSAYRSYAQQKQEYDDCVANTGQENADQEFARPGHSEHQTGLAIDILQDYFTLQGDAGFENTEQYAWLHENAYKYGFIQRYIENCNAITGYMTEPWHWRYVGVEVATAMKRDGVLIYEEYYGKHPR